MRDNSSSKRRVCRQCQTACVIWPAGASVSKCDTLSKAFACSKNVVIKSLPISQTFLYTYKKIDFFKVSSFFIKDAKIITEVGQILRRVTTLTKAVWAVLWISLCPPGNFVDPPEFFGGILHKCLTSQNCFNN